MTYQIIFERQKELSNSIKTHHDVFKLVKRYGKSKKEQFILITLNGALEPISISFVSIGIVNRTIVHPREVFIKAILDLASLIIICHNHPSGRLKPSKEDLKITDRLCQAGRLIGIPVFDHIIFTAKKHLSLREQGYIKTKIDV